MLEEVPLWATRVVGNIPFFSSLFCTGPNRFRAVLTQLVPGTHGPIPYPGSGTVLGHAGETITSAGNRLANSEFHARHKPPEPCAFLRRTCGREAETQWAVGARHPQTRRAVNTPGGPAAATSQMWPDLVQTRSQFTTRANRSTLQTSGEAFRSIEWLICIMHVWPIDKQLYFI